MADQYRAGRILLAGGPWSRSSTSARASPALSRRRPHEREQLPVGVGFAVRLLPGDIGVSLGTTDSLVRFSEVAPICAPLLRSTPLASTHRNGYEQNHEDDRDRDDDNDDAGAHLVCLLDCPDATIPKRGRETSPPPVPDGPRTFSSYCLLFRQTGPPFKLDGPVAPSPCPYAVPLGAKVTLTVAGRDVERWEGCDAGTAGRGVAPFCSLVVDATTSVAVRLKD